MTQPRAAPRFSTLALALRRHAADDPTAPLYVTTTDGETEDDRIPRGELDRRARAIGAALQGQQARGERALLLYPPGIDYVAGFFGCLYAGTIAVPAYPPDPFRLERTLPRLLAILASSRASVVLTTTPLLAIAVELFSQAPELAKKRWIATDALPPGCESAYVHHEPSGRDTAFLQYTSGSTGAPRGVVLTHDNLVHNEELITTAMCITQDSVVMSWLPPYHDMGLIGTILAPLYAGGRACLMSPMAFLQRPLRWLKAISTFRATISGGPNFAYDLCARKVSPDERASLDLSSWAVAFSGAEPVRAETLDRFTEAFAPSRFSRKAFFPCYGLAEAALIVSGGSSDGEPMIRGADREALERGEVVLGSVRPGARSLVGCGRPVTEVAVVDPASRVPVQTGMLGEIWVAGESVAGGYFEDPEQTDRAFGARTLEGAGPFLRTGDLGFLHDGQLFIAGRAKDLILLRGKNHYPDDLERATEEAHPALRRGCAAAFSIERAGEERLAVVVEVERGFDPGATAAVVAAVRGAIAEASGARVDAVALLAAGTIPKTSSGKIRRREARAAYLQGRLDEVARSVLDEESSPEQAPFVAPRTPLEAAIAAVWADVLGADRVGAGDDFFALGGHSLLATQAITRMRESLGVDLTLRELFEQPTLGAFAEHVEALLGEGAAPVTGPVPRLPRTEPLPLSFAQERLWFLAELDPHSVAYNVPVALRLKGPLEPSALEESLGAILQRHEALRTRFVVRDSHPVQVVFDSPPVRLPMTDLSGSPPEDRELALQTIASTEARRPFDLEHGPLFRAQLVRLDDTEHVLLVTAHHIVSDGTSMAVLVREMSALYEAFRAGRPSPLPALSFQYADWAAHERARLTGPAHERLLAHWGRALEGAPEALDLPLDRPRPRAPTHAGARLPITVPGRVTRALHDLARGEGATLFMALLASFHLLLARLSGQDDIVTGSPVAGRAAAGADELIGLFANTLVLRGDLRGDPTYRDLVRRERETALAAYAHQELPLEKLVEALSPTRAPGLSPLFQAMFALQNVRMPGASFAGLTLSGEQTPTGTSKLDLTLELAERDSGLHGFFEYATDLFDLATVERWAGHFLCLLESAGKAPDTRVWDLPITADPPAPRDRPVASSTLPLHRLFEAQVDRRPDAVAVVFEDSHVSYRELDERSGRLARRLARLGVGRGSLVGLLLERSIDMVAAVLAVMKAGGAYVPLDPAYPRERLEHMLEDSSTRVVVTHRGLAERVSTGPAALLQVDDDLAGERADRLAIDVDRADLAYVLYTSGSTGKPKGVSVPHGALVHFIEAMQGLLGLSETDTLLSVTSLSFDIAGLELYLPLTTGAAVEIAGAETSRDGALLRRRLEAGGVSLLQATPSTWQMLLDAGFRGSPGLTCLCGGEALPPALAAALLERGASLWNLYGPTETTIWSTAHRFPAGDATVLLGQPIGETELHVLGPRLEPVPPGACGELFIGGEGVARGYLGRPALTAERFVPDPFASTGTGRRLYRTGDRVRRRADGHIEFLGRTDHQVKIRGHRVELGEIEAILGRHEAIREVVVMACDTPTGKRLVAYHALAEGASEPSAAELRAHLLASVEEAMVPSLFITLPALPRTLNGKIDRKRLPAPSVPDRAGQHTEPRGLVEQALASIWAEVLGAPRVSASADFFELGGHSLLATQVVSRVQRALSVDLPLRAVFEAPVLSALAERIESLRATRPLEAFLPIPRAARTGDLPASFAQERLWVLDRLAPGNPFYNVSAALRLRGLLDAGALERSLSELVRRHEALRTTLSAPGGRPAQVIHPPRPVDLAFEDVPAGSSAETDALLAEIAAVEARRPFDLETGPLVRYKLIRVDSTDHVLLFTMHHVVSDEWSRGVLIREMAALYDAARRGAPHDLPELPIQYADHAAWQRETQRGDRLEEQVAYWRERLSTISTNMDLPADRPRPAQPSHRGARVSVTIPAEVTSALEGLSRQEGATLFMTLLSAFCVLLARHTGEHDVSVGTPVAGRTHPDTEGLIGLFANTLVLRTDLSGDPTFRALLARTKETCLGAYAHQDVPFERVVEEVLPGRDAGRTPLFQALFALRSAPAPELHLRGLSITSLDLETGTSKLDLGLELTRGGAGLAGYLEYATDLFDRATVARFARRLEAIVEDAAARPDAPISGLTALGAEERTRILEASAPRRKAVLPARLQELLGKPRKGR